MNVKIIKEEVRLVLCYSPSWSDKWIDERIENGGPVPIKCEQSGRATFVFIKNDFLRKEENSESIQELNVEETAAINHVWYFQLGVRENNGYYRIPARILSSSHDVLVHEDVEVSVDYFMTSVLNTRIVPIIDRMIGAPLYIGGEEKEALPVDEYKEIIRKLPNRDELHLYAQSRIEGVLSEYVPDTRESSIELAEYMKRKFDRAKRTLNKSHVDVDMVMDSIREIDCTRITFTLKRMKELLNSENKLTEQQWQNQIEKIILLLLPEYMAKISQLEIPETINKGHHRRIDMALVSISGNVDIVEVKRPSASQLLSRKPNYRGNYIPSRDLSAAVMQAEKYLANLERWGNDGERAIAKRIHLDRVTIRTPKTILILGRTAELDNDQKKSDFEIIRRKFANVIDVLTYDDLIARLENLLLQLNAGNR